MKFAADGESQGAAPKIKKLVTSALSRTKRIEGLATSSGRHNEYVDATNSKLIMRCGLIQFVEGLVAGDISHA